MDREMTPDELFNHYMDDLNKICKIVAGDDAPDLLAHLWLVSCRPSGRHWKFNLREGLDFSQLWTAAQNAITEWKRDQGGAIYYPPSVLPENRPKEFELRGDEYIDEFGNFQAIADHQVDPEEMLNVDLTEEEQTIVDMLLAGRSRQEIGKTIGRSQVTLRRRIDSIGERVLRARRQR